jgi:hypothetical protein
MGIKIGTVVGTGAAINVSCGFQPEAVILFNGNDAGAAHPIMFWADNMAAASAIKLLAATQARISTLGISTYPGTSAGAGKGFTIGADTDMNVAGESLTYIALRSNLTES